VASKSEIFAKIGTQFMNGFITVDEAVYSLVEAGWTHSAAEEHVARWSRIGAVEPSSSQK
jgi:hypothetical protein